MMVRPRRRFGSWGLWGDYSYDCGCERVRDGCFLRHKLYIICLMLRKTEYYKRKLALWISLHGFTYSYL
jgi:hypothetical protein